MDDLIITADDTLPIVEHDGQIYDLVLQGGNDEPTFHIESTLSGLEELVYKISMALHEARA